MKPGGTQWQVDDELLTETGRGGLFTDGYLEGEPLISYLDEDETPLFVFGSGKRGITRERDESTDRVVPASGYRAITAVTDRRIQFVVGGGRESGDWADDVRLADVESVSVESGLIREQLSITSSDGTTWRVYLKDVDTDRVVTFLEDVSWAWIQVEELLDEARKELVDASQYEKSREYDKAKSAVSNARRILNDAADRTEDLAAEAGAGIRARIDQVERRYRETKRRVHASRATHLVDRAERNWREDKFEPAYELFDQARTEYLEVLDIYGLDPDKADAMRERIEHVDGNLNHLSRAPLRRANEDRERALAADDLAEALDHWESALRNYRRVIELDWGRAEQRFEGDVDMVRDRVAETVDEIISTRRTIADTHRDRAQELLDDGHVGQAREAYADAMDCLEGAVQLAREFQPEAVEDLHDRLETLESRIRNATSSVSNAGAAAGDSPTENGHSETDFERDGDESAYDDFDNWVTLADEEESAPTVEGTDAGDDDSDGRLESEDANGADDADRETLEAISEMVESVNSETGSNGSDLEPDPSPGTDVGPAEPLATDGLDELLVDNPEPDPVVIDALTVLGATELAELAAAIWDELGWETTLEDGTVVATRSAPVAETTVLAIVADGTTTETDVTAVAEVRGDRDADRGVLVTNVSVAPSAARSALEADIEVIDVESLAALIERESLADHLPDARV